jgi:hypothetical protein
MAKAREFVVTGDAPMVTGMAKMLLEALQGVAAHTNMTVSEQGVCVAVGAGATAETGALSSLLQLTRAAVTARIKVRANDIFLMVILSTRGRGIREVMRWRSV